MKPIWIHVLSLIFIMTCLCCSRPGQDDDVVSMFGRKVYLPTNLEYTILDSKLDTIADSGFDFRIVTYIDSSDCTACSLMLSQWTEFLDVINGVDSVNVDFIMIVESHDKEEISGIIARGDFKHKVAIVADSEFEKINKLPSKKSMRTLLLDEKNKVVLVGNPVSNPKVKDLYKKHIFDSEAPEKNIYDDYIFCGKTTVALGAVELSDSAKVNFTIKNIGKTSLSLQEIITSCGCIEACIDMDTIYPKQNASIVITYTAKEVIGPFKKHIDIFFNEIDEPFRLTVYGENINNNRSK